MGDLALGIIRQLDLSDKPFEVVYSGSFFNGSPIVQYEMENVVNAQAPYAKFIPLKAPSAIGGVLLGMKLMGVSPEEIAKVRKNLVSSYSNGDI